MNAASFLSFLNLLLGDGKNLPLPGQIADGTSNTLLVGESSAQFAALMLDFVVSIIAILIGL